MATVGKRTGFHLRFGWWSLLVFLMLGVVLEAMHGFKIGWYLDVDNEVRRLTFTLAHAHGAILGLLHIALAATIHLSRSKGWAIIFASRGLVIASVLIPLGFFLGGFGIEGGDPGVGVVFVPIGALALFASVALTGYVVRGTGR